MALRAAIALSLVIALLMLWTGAGDGELNTKKRHATFLQWAATFQAPNPKNQAYCHAILTQRNGSASQYDQDLFVFFNLFSHWPLHDKKGVYVDSGANDARVGSNTYFFDVCLGWAGLCVEPDARYHAALRAERSCTLIDECISDGNKTVSMVPPKHGAFMKIGIGGSNGGGSGGAMKCDSLASMLARAGLPPKVDFWSLDVEGHEMAVLGSVDFDQVHVGVLLVEDYSISTRLLDRLLSEQGYNKFHQLPVDTVHVRRSAHRWHGAGGEDEVWYPASYNQSWATMQAWREGKDKPLLIC